MNEILELTPFSQPRSSRAAQYDVRRFHIGAFRLTTIPSRTKTQLISHPMDDDTQLKTLINSTVSISVDLLRQQSTVDPFAAYLDQDGELQLIAPWMGTEPKPPNEQVAYLKEACLDFRRKGNATAFAVIYDAELTDPASGEQLNALINCVSLRSDEEMDFAAFYSRNGEDVTIEKITRVR